MNEDYRKFIPNVNFEAIPIKNLVSNQDYQRNLSVKHVQKAAAHFDLYQINPVKVSRRDGINYVFNGQHTIEIVAQVSGSRETPVWCMVYDDLAYEREADIFANQMKFTKPLNPYEIFMANIEAGSDDEIIIKDLVESYGLQISAASGPGNICAVASLEYVYKRYGYKVLDRVLYLAIGTWEGAPQSLSANMIRAIARLVATYGKDLKDATFKEKLGQISCREVIRTAKERKAGSLGFAEAILNFYNKKTRRGLEWGRLYAKKSYMPTGEDVAPETDIAEEVDDDDRLSLEESEDEMEETSSFEQMGFMDLMEEDTGREELLNK